MVGVFLILAGVLASADPQVGFEGALETKARGNLAEAELQLRQVCDRSPGWALPWIELAEVQLSRGGLDAALASITQAGVLDAVNPRVYHDRALIEQALGRLDLAEKDEAFAIELRPEYREARANLAELLWREGKRQQAVAMLEALAAENPEQVAYAVRLADAYSDLGSFVAAERELRTLIAREPNYPVWHRRLARLLASQGLVDEAAHETELADRLSQHGNEPRKMRSLPKSKH